MLDLSVSTRTVAGIDLARDTDDLLKFYALPPAPRVAMANGAADVQLLRFVKDGELQGGNLRLGVDLQHPQAALDQAQGQLENELKRGPVTLVPAPSLDASAEVHFVGTEPTAGGGVSSLLRRSYGRTAASFTPPYPANFSISLTPEGVRLVEAAMRSGGAPVGVSYWLKMEGLWPAQQVFARVDWGRVYDHFSMQEREGFFLFDSDIQKITEHLIETRAITIQVIRGVAATGDLASQDDGSDAVMRWIQRELVERFCEPVLPLNRQPAHADLGTLGEMFGVGSAYAVKKLTQIEQATAEIDFQQRRVVTRTIAPQAHLADLLGGQDAAQYIVDAGADHPFFQRMVLNVRAAQQLPSLHLKEAVVQVNYGTAQQALRLTPESPSSTFSAWADSSPDRSWTAHAEITFADDSPIEAGKHFILDTVSGQTRELTLDFKQMLGLARCNVRLPGDSRVMLGDLKIAHLRGGETVGETQLGLPAKGPEQVAWFRDCRPGDQLQASLRYLLTDGRMITLPTFPVDTEILRLPYAFPGVLTVQIIADDDWGGLDRVAVAVQKSADAPATTFVFDKPGKVEVVNLDMPDPTDRSFRYRVTRTLSSGVEESDEWMQTDIAVVVAGKIAANRLVVDLVPLGPELPQAGVRLLQVELSYVDSENQVREQATMAIAAKADKQRWEIAIKDPHRRAYEYRTTVFPLAGGAPVVGHWTSSTERILAVPIALPS